MTPEPRTIFEVCGALPDRDGFRLLPWRYEQAHCLFEAWTDPVIAEWNPVPPDPTLKLARSWVSGTNSQNEASIGIDVVLVDFASDVVAGEVGLQVDPSQGIAEVGFWLASGFRGKGIGKTLLTAAQDLAGELELLGLVALVDPGNAAAIGLLEHMAWPELPTKSERRAFAYRTP